MGCASSLLDQIQPGVIKPQIHPMNSNNQNNSSFQNQQLKNNNIVSQPSYQGQNQNQIQNQSNQSQNGGYQQQFNGLSQQQFTNYPQQVNNGPQQQINSNPQFNNIPQQQFNNNSQQAFNHNPQQQTFNNNPQQVFNNNPQQSFNNNPQQAFNNNAQQPFNNNNPQQQIFNSNAQQPFNNNLQQQYNGFGFPQQGNELQKQNNLYNQPKNNIYAVQQSQNNSNHSQQAQNNVLLSQQKKGQQNNMSTSKQSAIVESNKNIQNQGSSWLNDLVGGSDHKQKYKVTGKRGTMQLYVNKNDDFLTHHLKNELSLSKYSGAQKIRRRQIVNHYRFQIFFNHGYGQSAASLSQFSIKSYLQRVLFQIFVDADREFFELNKSIDEVRHKIAQRYLFELYQLKQFADAAFGKFSLIIQTTQIPMSSTSVASDSALYPALRYLKQKYPQVADQSKIQFPDVKQLKNDVNLLDNFDSKCYSTPNLVNIQTLFSDLKFLIDRSIQQFSDFQKDMKIILGEDVLTDSKVKKVTKNGKDQYTSSPVRRVFIKWTQTIIQRIPNIILSQAFLDFIKSKSKMADNFYFKSTVQSTTHSLVIEYLCNLLQSAKYDITTLAKTKQFGFYIYDLLRCKVKRNTGQQIVEVLNKMKATSITASGKKFQVVRVKNRFKTPNRDLMVNFRYGDVIVGQAQLCIDTSDVSQKTKKINKFNHYIYQLQRGLFGPTFQLIMQFQDFERKDISANLQAEGKVLVRKSKKPLTFLKKADRKCFHGHQMICLVGNYFLSDDKGNFQQQSQIRCDYCLKSSTTKTTYHYCYFCSILFCTNCHQDYKKQNLKQIQLICNKDNIVPHLKNQKQLNVFCTQNNSAIVIFYISKGSANVIFKDSIIYYMCVYKMQKKQLPLLAFFNCDDPSTENILKRFDIQSFPTTILFDRNMNPQISLIGASFSQIQGIFESQKLLNQNKLKCLPLVCHCGEILVYTQNQNQQNFLCSYCGNTDKSQGLLDYFIGQNKSELFVCQNGHTRCYSCSYLGRQQPVKFRDYLGRSYLCNQRIIPSPLICLKGHSMIYSHINNYKSTQFKCFKCNSQFYFNDQLGMGSCNQCQTFSCPKCHSIHVPTLSDSKGELVSHTVQSTAEQGQKCICGRLFKKVYNTRLFQKEQQQEQNEDQFTAALVSIFNEKKHNWTCIICQRVKVDGQLHLACFNCPRLEKTNIQICIQCSIGSNLLNKSLEQKHLEVQGDFVCKLNHKVVRSTINYDLSSMTYNCYQCKTIFYSNTERYYCKTCKTNTCFQCAKKQLKNSRPPQCLRKCADGHKLVTNQKPLQLRFCDGCRTVIKGIHFVCFEMCSFDLCLSCAATPPGTNTMKMKHIQDQKTKKQMQKYFSQAVQNYNQQGSSNVGQYIDDLFGW